MQRQDGHFLILHPICSYFAAFAKEDEVISDGSKSPLGDAPYTFVTTAWFLVSLICTI